ncbi:hypothetical protein BpHYR1_018211 [Brachionus plicatilis]|uniref:Uncharacterized protein n=1 Tax=Brachionus plicatilis TaxID=10195 RepID=A0A3M7S2Z3_BRAPC|nr:hypothetical protein BpHYR1_018211 [Brachionus plicatilis]
MYNPNFRSLAKLMKTVPKKIYIYYYLILLFFKKITSPPNKKKRVYPMIQNRKSYFVPGIKIEGIRYKFMANLYLLIEK